jgi:hypothetical protein
MNHGYVGGKRNREVERDRKKKEKEERLRRNRASASRGGESEVASVTPLPEVRLEDVVIGVPSRPRRDTAGPVKLFVGALSWDTTTEGLRAAFSRMGTLVDAVLISDRETGRSRGFGFVTFENARDADKAIAEMNGAELDGRTLKVNRAEAR